MTVTLEFTPILKRDGVFTGCGRYAVDIQGKLGWVTIYADGDVKFHGWCNSEILSEKEKSFFKEHNNNIKTK